MTNNNLDRRQFNQLTAAAFGGLVAGTMTGCGGGTGDPVASTTATDKHLCRGLNECKGKGAEGKNACRGQGTCATVAEHACGGMNDCKSLGGCGADAGRNACKGKGGCHVPLMDDAWKAVRGMLETKWKGKQADFGAAPAKAEKVEKIEPMPVDNAAPAERTEPK